MCLDERLSDIIREDEKKKDQREEEEAAETNLKDLNRDCPASKDRVGNFHLNTPRLGFWIP